MHFRFIWHRSPPYLRGGPLPGILCGVPGVTLDRISKDFKIGLESWLFKILNILGRFLESKMESPNHFWLMIWVFFFDVAFCIDFYLFSDGSKPWKLSSRLGGSTIFTKSTFSLSLHCTCIHTHELRNASWAKQYPGCWGELPIVGPGGGGTPPR